MVCAIGIMEQEQTGAELPKIAVMIGDKNLLFTNFLIKLKLKYD